MQKFHFNSMNNNWQRSSTNALNPAITFYGEVPKFLTLKVPRTPSYIHPKTAQYKDAVIYQFGYDL